jgi:acetyl esterase/lipase
VVATVVEAPDASDALSSSSPPQPTAATANAAARAKEARAWKRRTSRATYRTVAARTARRYVAAMASEELQMIVTAMRSGGLPDDADVHELRALMDSWVGDGAPADATVEEVDANGVPAEWVRADGCRRDAALLYLHGGGYCIGSVRSHRGLAAHLSRAADVSVLLVDYRLAPEHPHPAAVEDATAAYRYLLGCGFDAHRLAVAGDSAGGGLTFTTLLSLRDHALPMPAAAVAISPWTDLGCNSPTFDTRAELDPMCSAVGLKRMADWFLNGQDPFDPLAAPVHADLTGLPPVLVHVGDHEVLLDDSKQIVERARAVGVDATLEVWPEMIHVWHAFVGVVPESADAVDRVGEYLRSHVAR